MKVTTDGCLFGAWAEERVRNRESGVGRVLDIGTGTGLLALMLAQQTDLFIDAVEIDSDAAEQASANVAASPWSERINIITGDTREFAFSHKYDVIISNPPFYEKELKGDDAKKNIAHHNEGLLLPELLDCIKKNLTPSGSFYLLLPYKRNEEIKKLLTENDFAVEQITFVRQTASHDYFRMMLEGKFKMTKAGNSIIDEIFIRNGDKEYSSDFIALLKDYYLHL